MSQNTIINLTENQLKNIINESVTILLTEKHRPSGVTKRIHTRDANGKKQSFDYIKNLPKYNKHKDFAKASKFQRINAREVDNEEGENIDTILKDGTIERKGLHVPKGHYIVNNVGGTEQWGIDPKTFKKKYEEDPEQEGVYKPKGGPMLASEPLKRNTSFEAPWGGRMDMKAGSRILQDPTNPKDTYGIGGDEFDSTYRFDESIVRTVADKELKRIIKESVKTTLNEVQNLFEGQSEKGKKPKKERQQWTNEKGEPLFYVSIDGTVLSGRLLRLTKQEAIRKADKYIDRGYDNVKIVPAYKRGKK